MIMKVIVVLFLLVSNLWSLGGGVVSLRGAPASSPDERLYLSAARSFQGGHWSTSAIWLKELVDRYPNSPRRPKSALLLGQSYYKQKQYKQAYAVLSNNRLGAGSFAEQYVYWMAECRFRQGSLEAADQIFGELLREFPDSSHKLEAIISSAFIAAKREDWSRVVTLLRPANGLFQVQLGAGAEGDLLQEGCLLLSEALLKQKDPRSAKILLDVLPRAMTEDRARRRELLNLRVIMASGGFLEAMQKLNELQDGDAEWLMQVVRLKAALLVKQNEWLLAAQAYMSLSDENLSPAARKEMFFKAALYTVQGGEREAAKRLLKSMFNYPELEQSFALVNCVLAEMTLEEGGRFKDALKYFEAADGNSADQEIQARLLWGIGRCHHLLGDAASASDYHYKALNSSKDDVLRADMLYSQGLIRMSSGDWDRAVKDFDGALKLKDTGTSLRDSDAARYMQIKAVLKTVEPDNAKLVLSQFRNKTSSLYNNALLLMAQESVTRGLLDEADNFLVELRQQESGRRLLAAAELEHIRMQVSRGKWTESLALYDKWIKEHPDSELLAKVKLDRAWALNRSGQVRAAELAYREIAGLRNGSPEVFASKIWLADKAFNTVTNRIHAERLYQEVAGATNSPVRLRQRAQMMAGRAAVARQGYDDARKSFAALLEDPSTDEDIKTQAIFALGDLTLIDIGSSAEEALPRLIQSTNAFYSVVQISPTNKLASKAWGKIGDGCLLISKDHPNYLLHAKKAYEKSLSIPVAIEVSASSQARMGLAYTIERLAAGKSAEEELYGESLGLFLAVFYGRHLGSGQKHDPYWRGQSGLAALRMLEKLKRYDQAQKLCEELEFIFPGMKTGLRARKERIKRIQEKRE